MRSIRLLLFACPLLGSMGACASGASPDDRSCTYVRHEGMCEATVTLDPRESESPDEATMLEIRWSWAGVDVGEVPDRVVRRHLVARDARAIAEAVEETERSRCLIEQAVEPDSCVGILRIVWVEADP